MSDVTTDPNDPRLKRGIDENPTAQSEAYLIKPQLPEEYRSRGFIRPLRHSYVHQGKRPKHPTRELTADEKERHSEFGYVLFEQYPSDGSGISGRFWSQKMLSSGCGVVTKMSTSIAETYARDPKFYGATYCVGCQKHLPVEEFVWDKDGSVVGS